MEEGTKETLMKDETAEHFVTVIGTLMSEAWDDDYSDEIKKAAYQDAVQYAKDSWEEKSKAAVLDTLERIEKVNVIPNHEGGDPYEWRDSDNVDGMIAAIRTEIESLTE